MTEAKHPDLDESLRHDSEVCKRGMETEFWEIVKRIITLPSDQAKEVWLVTDPSDLSTMAQLQATVKVVDKLIKMVEDTASLT